MANHHFDPHNDAGWHEFEKQVRENLIPKLENTDLFVSVTPLKKEEVDIKFAVELGLAIMYDKPIIAAIQPGMKVPEKLTRVVDKFVELDMHDPSQRQRLVDAIKEMQEDVGDSV
jgi:nucleoside 2-deoxyribosyltransferase